MGTNAHQLDAGALAMVETSEWAAARIVEVYRDRERKWRWRRCVRRGRRIVADGGQGYGNHWEGIRAARRENPGIEIVEVTTG